MESMFVWVLEESYVFGLNKQKQTARLQKEAFYNNVKCIPHFKIKLGD